MPLLTLHELEQRAPLFQGKIGNVLARGAMRLLSVDRINTLYDKNAHLRGIDFTQNILHELGIIYNVFAEKTEVLSQLESLNASPFITISNHPYGSIDGIILADFFGHRCSSYKIMANKMLSRIKPLDSSFISVTPTGAERTIPTAESIIGMRHALEQIHSGGALGLFPAGAVSNLNLRHNCIEDRTWQPAIIRFIAKAKVPILPVRFYDGNSWFYYSLGLIDWRLRLLRLPAEIFNKSNRPVRLGLGSVISVEEQQQYLATHSTEEFGLWLRDRVYRMTID